MGMDIPIRLWADSTAAIGICSRQGLGKIRHLDTHTLWVQQAVRAKRFTLHKVLGEKNPADLMTKHSITRDKMAKLVELQNCRFLSGRAESAAKVREGAGHGGPSLAEVNAVDDPDEPFMPHRSLSQEALEVQFPAIEVPDGIIADECQDDGLDQLLRASEPIINDIVLRAHVDGRLRREK